MSRFKAWHCAGRVPNGNSQRSASLKVVPHLPWRPWSSVGDNSADTTAHNSSAKPATRCSLVKHNEPRDVWPTSRKIKRTAHSPSHT